MPLPQVLLAVHSTRCPASRRSRSFFNLAKHLFYGRYDVLNAEGPATPAFRHWLGLAYSAQRHLNKVLPEDEARPLEIHICARSGVRRNSYSLEHPPLEEQRDCLPARKGHPSSTTSCPQTVWPPPSAIPPSWCRTRVCCVTLPIDVRQQGFRLVGFWISVQSNSYAGSIPRLPIWASLRCLRLLI